MKWSWGDRPAAQGSARPCRGPQPDRRSIRITFDDGVLPGVTLPSAVKSLVASSECDRVIVSTPPNSHEVPAVAAMEQGKHVIVESSWRIQ